MEKSAVLAVKLWLLLAIAQRIGTVIGSPSGRNVLQSEEQADVVTDIVDWDDELEGKPTIRILTDDNFEHDTQAATGQTTGNWLVLFWSKQSPPSEDAEGTLQQVLTRIRPGSVIIAEVNASSNPRTVKRFNVQKLPLLILLRDRRMFTYNGHWAVMNIIKFVESEYKNAPFEEVPKEISGLDEVLEVLGRYYFALITYLANRPGLLAAVGSTFAMGGYVYTKRWLMRKQLERPTRPRKRVD